MKFWVTYPLAAHGASSAFAQREVVLRFAQVAEASGFDGIGFTDHPAPTERWLRAGGHAALDPFAALAFVAAVTDRIQLIPNICVLPYRNPFIVAKMVATISVLSGDRFVLAAGTGYLRGEFRALGVDPDQRNELFDEALDVLRGIWTTDDFNFEGRHFAAPGQTASPKPARPVPIWIGGNSRRARQRVADAGDGWNPFRAQASVAATTRTTALEGASDLSHLLDDLWERVDGAGRERSEIDVAFSTEAGGSPATGSFDAAAHLEGLDALAALGVTWTSADVATDSVDHALESLERYGTEIIAAHRA